MKSESLMNWEIEWVKANAHRYQGEYHVKAVIANIKKRYQMKEMTAEINRGKVLVAQYAANPITKHKFEMLEFFEQEEVYLK